MIVLSVNMFGVVYMSDNSIRKLINRTATKGGMKPIKIISVCSVNIAKDEWCRWLDYIPDKQEEKQQRLSSKPWSKLTKKEKEWLEQIELEARISYQLSTSKKLTPEQSDELTDYWEVASIDQLVNRKLTDEEYSKGKEIAKNLIETLNEKELKKLFNDSVACYKKLDIQKSFVLREIGKVVKSREEKKDIELFEGLVSSNDAMRGRTMIYAEKHS